MINKHKAGSHACFYTIDGKSDRLLGDSFGVAVALSDNTAVIGAYRDDTAAGVDAGSAYVFVRSGDVWIEQRLLLASDGDDGDYFGYSVSVSGPLAIIGACNDNVAADFDVGSAYVFVRSGGDWNQQAKLSASDAAAVDFFGTSVSISGGTAIVGSTGANSPSIANAGSVYVFVQSGTTWSQQAKLSASDGAPNDFFGISVALVGDTALVGSFWNDTAAGVDAGSAYVFVRNGTSWTQQAQLFAADGARADLFGISVALSGETALIGAMFDDTTAGNNAGSAYVFVRAGSDWNEQAKLSASDGSPDDNFGCAVAIRGETALVGAFRSEAPGLGEVGSAYVFTREGTLWSERDHFFAPQSSGGSFGYSVALSGDTALVGAYGDQGVNTSGGTVFGQGSAYVFRLSGLSPVDSDGDGASDEWEQANGFASDVFGDFVSLDADRDGETDLLEIYQGTDRSSAVSRHGLTGVAATGSSEIGSFTTRFRRSNTQSAVVGRWEWSVDLVNWQAPNTLVNGIQVEITQTVVGSGPDYEICESTATFAAGRAQSLFLRLVLQPVE